MALSLLVLALSVSLASDLSARLPDQKPAVPAVAFQNVPATGTAVRSEAEAIARHGFSEAEVGYLLFDPETGQTIKAHQADASFIPASVSKVPAMAAALAILGADHHFNTSVLATGPIVDGVLQGDLILRGGGDPSFSTESVLNLVGQLQAAGLKRVSGRFLYDALALPEMAEIDPTQPWSAGYNTGISALGINHNRSQIVWRHDPSGKLTVQAWSVSGVGRHPLDSVSVTLADKGPLPFTRRLANDAEDWLFAPASMAATPPAGKNTGKKARQPTETRVWLPISQPARAAAAVFRRVAEDGGISMPVAIRSSAVSQGAELAVHQSEPLDVLARQVLRFSNNLSTELIGLAAARRLDPTVTTLDQSAALLTRWMQQHSPAVNWQGFLLANHSGLSSQSRMSPRQMAAVLRWSDPILYALLPGEDDGRNLPGGVRAKSGTMAYGKGLAGYLTGADGKRVGFVYFVTNHENRAAMDAVMDRRIAEMPAKARSWLSRSRDLQVDLLQLWSNRPL